MHRTLERDHFRFSGVSAGEVLVASSFTHPVRGAVDCPAGPVVVAAMRTTGLPVRLEPLPPTGTGDAVLHTASYLDPGGAVVGLGVAAHRGDEAVLRRAEEVVRTWAGAMRTRSMLVADTGPACAGLRREAALVAGVAGPAYVLAAGRYERPFSWARRDVRVVERLADVPDGATVVLPAHGVTPSVREECAARSLRVTDATCPLVARTHATTRRFTDEGATVVVIGADGHAAVPPILGHATGDVAVVGAPKDVDDLEDLEDLAPAGRLAFVVSPGLAVEDSVAIAARLRARFPGTRGQHPDEYCYAASDRRAAAHAVAAASELTLVLGAEADADTRALAETAATAGCAVACLDDLSRLTPASLASSAAIGIVVARSAGPALLGAVVEALSGLGPLSVTRRQVTTEVARPGRTSVRRAS